MKPLAMVVGASRRVGREVALELVRAGFDLVLTFPSDQVGGQGTKSLAVDLGAILLPQPVRTSSQASNFSRVIFLHTLISLGHFLKQTQNPFKKYFPHADQRLIGVEPRVCK